MNFWRRHALAQTTIAMVMAMWLAVMPALLSFSEAYADELTQEAEKGQRTGANFLLNYDPPAVNDAAPPADPSDYFDAGGNLINEIYSQEIFPGYNPADPTPIDDLSNLRNTPEDLTTQGFGQTLTLGVGADENSQAYQALEDASVNPNDYDLRADPFLDTTREIVSGDATILDEILTGCVDNVTAGTPGADGTTRIEDIWTCSQARIGPATSCTVTRNFQLVPLETKEVLRVEATGNAACGTGNDLSDWEPLFIWPISAGGNAPAEYCIATGSLIAATGWFLRYHPPGVPFNPDNIFATFCGERDTQIPTPAQCDATGRQLEHACRNADPGGSLAEWELNAAHPIFGPSGSCSSYAPGAPTTFSGVVAVDYTGCDADRVSYCQSMVAEFEAECKDECGSCEAADNVALYNFGGYFDNAGVVTACRTYDQFFNQTSSPDLTDLAYNGRTFSFAVREALDPGDWELRGWSTNACGTLANGDCSVMGRAFEQQCNGIAGWPVEYAGGTPPDIAAYCAAERATYEANCAAANTCISSGGGAGLLTGSETITTPAIGAGTTLENQSLFGTTVDLIQDPLNPSDYGLLAGQYVVGSQVVVGGEVVAQNIDYGGSYATNWDFDFTATVVDAPGFTVEATLYEIVANDFTFSGCAEADVNNVNTGFCAGTIACTDYTPPCRIVDGVEICEPSSPSDGITSILSPWNDFANGIPEMCWEAEVEVTDCVIAHDCFASGECVNDCADLPPELQPACEAPPCWIDANGNEVCLDSTAENWVDNLGEPGWVDDCADLLGRSECVLQPEIACVEGMESDTNPDDIDQCELRQRYFDCGYDVTVPGTPGSDQVDTTCEAEIRCFGDECANTVAESNPDFVRAATATTVIGEFQKDITCTVAGDPSTCTIFEGTDNRCKDPRGSWLGLIPDCCKESRQAGASVGGFVQYMQLAAWSWRLAQDPIVASYLSNLPGGSALEGVVSGPGPLARATSAVGNAVVTGFNSALQWAGMNPIETVSNSANVAADIAASPTGFGPVQQFIAQGFNNFLDTIGLDALGDSLFNTTAEGLVTGWAESGFGEMVSSALSVIGLIYTVYNILKILGSIFFACEEEELAFGIQQVNRACHYVGDYCSKKIRIGPFKKCVIETKTFCCFSSPLPRIMNEQLRAQGIGPDWGTAREPNCDGIAISDLDAVDWDLVDLSEWEAIMFEAGIIPDPRNPPTNFIPTDRHPGLSEGGTNEGVDSVTINTNTIDLIAPDSDEARFILDGEPLVQPDPELMPWYE